jgi:hypothetical protein
LICDNVPQVPLLWSLPYGKIAVISTSIAEKLSPVVSISHASLLEKIDAGHEERARKYADRSAEALLRGSVPPPAVTVLRTRFSALHVSRVFPREATSTFPATVHELAAMEACESFSDVPESLVLALKGNSDWGVTLLRPTASSPADASSQAYVVVRMSRNSLSTNSENNDFRLRLEDLLEEGRGQLQRAAEMYSTRHLSDGAPAVAYYEADMVFKQQRVATALLPREGRVLRVPFLFLRAPKEADEVPPFMAALRELYTLKKGDAI